MSLTRLAGYMLWLCRWVALASGTWFTIRVLATVIDGAPVTWLVLTEACVATFCFASEAQGCLCRWWMDKSEDWMNVASAYSKEVNAWILGLTGKEALTTDQMLKNRNASVAAVSGMGSRPLPGAWSMILLGLSLLPFAVGVCARPSVDTARTYWRPVPTVQP